MKKMIMNYVAAAAAAVLLAGNAMGAIILVDWQDGSLGYEYNNWGSSAFGGFGAPSPVGFDTGGGGGVDVGGRDAIEITGSTADEIPRGYLFSTTAFNGPTVNYNGSGSNVNAITFDFYATGTAPSGLGFYFQSTGGSHWFYNISSIGAADTWNTYEVGVTGSGWLGYANINWTGDPLVGVDAAWGAGIQQLGMFVFFNPTDAGQQYGLSDIGVGMTVPEPETYMALGMALLTVAFVFRKRITESLADARAMMQT